jgi:S1/P1 nuclease
MAIVVVIQMCVRMSVDRPALPLHAVWDGLLTSSNNARTLRNIATEFRIKFSRSALNELASTEPEAWARESFEIAKKIPYQNGALHGTPKGQRKDCRDVTDAQALHDRLFKNGKANRRSADDLAGYRLAGLLYDIR